MIIFSGQPGRVAVLADPGLPGQARFISANPELSYRLHRSMITRLGISQSSNFQFLHTLGNSIYVYVFGDRIGQLKVGGLSFAGDCDLAAPGHGIENLLDYYRRNRLSQRRDEMEIVIGTTPVRGFLVGMSAELADPNLRIMQFEYTLAIIPERDPADEVANNNNNEKGRDEGDGSSDKLTNNLGKVPDPTETNNGSAIAAGGGGYDPYYGPDPNYGVSAPAANIPSVYPQVPPVSAGGDNAPPGMTADEARIWQLYLDLGG